MASSFDKLMFRYEQLSGAMKFAVIGVLILIAFTIWDYTINPTQTRWLQQCNVLEQKLQRVNNIEQLRMEINDVRGAILSFGAVESLNTPKDAAAELQAVVNDLLEEYKRDISDDNFSSNRVEMLPRRMFEGTKLLNSSTEVAQRHAYTLEFTASPDVVTEILLRLEASPAVESISSIRIKREAAKKVSVRMEMEAWSRAPRNT